MSRLECKEYIQLDGTIHSIFQGPCSFNRETLKVPVPNELMKSRVVVLESTCDITVCLPLCAIFVVISIAVTSHDMTSPSKTFVVMNGTFVPSLVNAYHLLLRGIFQALESEGPYDSPLLRISSSTFPLCVSLLGIWYSKLDFLELENIL
jgi:hypothetical protein